VKCFAKKGLMRGLRQKRQKRQKKPGDELVVKPEAWGCQTDSRNYEK